MFMFLDKGYVYVFFLYTWTKVMFTTEGVEYGSSAWPNNVATSESLSTGSHHTVVMVWA